MAQWNAGYETEGGGWMRIITVYASTEAEARAEARRLLEKPGRGGFLKAWREHGEQVRRQ